MKQNKLIPKSNIQVGVLVPTYNNSKTLNQVLDGILKHSDEIIVVNDGSTDQTFQLLEKYPEIEVLHHKNNLGKGLALRNGFKRAHTKGYTHVITIDSDGQHFPDDIPQFMEKLNEHSSSELLLVGNRNMSQAGVPNKSSFGNRFSNFWYWVHTGIRLKDTQSGFRLYPINALKEVKFYTHKFEFEIEILVRSAWKGIQVSGIPIGVKYDKEERVSHFRPFRDFMRISALNTVLLMCTIFYQYPKRIVRKINKIGFKKFVFQCFSGVQKSPRKNAYAVALGLFIGLSPFWGFHTVIVLSLAILFNLNKMLAIAFSNISLPPFIPFVLLLSSKLGAFLLGENFEYSKAEMWQNFDAIKHLKVYIVGSFALAITSALVFGLLFYIIFSFMKLNRKA